MARKSYSTVSLPDSLLEKIDQIIKKDIMGYSSRAEFLKDASRRLIEKMKEGK